MFLPSREWKTNAFKRPEAQRWYSGETISVAIGQGYNNYTPLQLAHATAVLASGGMNATPRLVRAYQNPVSGQVTEKPLEAFKQLDLQERHVNSVKLGMRGAVLEGTARGVFRNVAYEVAGKTGTAQVFGLKKGETYKDRSALCGTSARPWLVHRLFPDGTTPDCLGRNRGKCRLRQPVCCACRQAGSGCFLGLAVRELAARQLA